MYTTQNTSNCHTYEKDNTCKKGFSKGQYNTTVTDKKLANAYVQLSAKVAKLKKKKVNMKVIVKTQTLPEGLSLVVWGYILIITK